MSRRTLYAWLALLPALAMLALFAHIPTIETLWHSLFYTASGGEPESWAGSGNYQSMLEDSVFWQSLRNTLLYAGITVPTSMLLALLMALWVNSRMPARALVRLAYFTPTMLPMIAVANIWLFFYTPQIGLFNQLLHSVGIPPVNWLGDPKWALPSLMMLTIWKEAGFFMLFYLAALQTLPADVYEACRVENASRLHTFRRVTLPLLMPTTLFVLINALINAFKMIDPLFILTKGGPNNATTLLLYYIYENAFSFFDGNYAAALTIVLLGLLATLALLQFGLLDRRIHYR